MYSSTDAHTRIMLFNCILQVQETFEVAEMERTIEDMIEEQRAKLHAEGKKVYNLAVYMHLYYSCR
jgi:hypothetical protein